MSEGEIKRRLAAILAADICGYSRLVGDDEEGTLKAVQSVIGDVVAPNIETYGGRIFKLMGDGVLAEFPSIVDAVRCAIDIQRSMDAHNEGRQDDQKLEFRIGVNLGDIISDGDDLKGDGVNIAARLEQIAETGGIYLSGSAFDQIHHKLEQDFDDLGHHKLKNILQPVHVYRVRSKGSRPALSKQPLFDLGPGAGKPTSVASGGCLCGSVRYEIDQPSIGAGFCHCSLCQRSIGAPVNAWAAFPIEAVHFRDRPPKIYHSSPIAIRGFCPDCGTSLTYQLIKPEPAEYIVVPIVTLDKRDEYSPTWHAGVESQIPWLDIRDDLPRTRCEDSPSLQEAWRSVGIGDPSDWGPQRR